VDEFFVCTYKDCKLYDIIVAYIARCVCALNTILPDPWYSIPVNWKVLVENDADLSRAPNTNIEWTNVGLVFEVRERKSTLVGVYQESCFFCHDIIYRLMIQLFSI
jgi:hypothetical protein